MIILLDYTTLLFFFFNDTATTEIYTLSLHDALPICRCCVPHLRRGAPKRYRAEWLQTRQAHHALRQGPRARNLQDRKSTRLNSSHANISYAVFCLKKKKQK